MEDCSRESMEDSSHESDVWLMLNQDGQTTWFRLVEVGEPGDIVPLSREPRTPTVVVDVALPVLPAFDGTAPERRHPAKSRLIQLNVRTVAGTDPTGVVVRPDRHEKPAAGSRRRRAASNSRSWARSSARRLSDSRKAQVL